MSESETIIKSPKCVDPIHVQYILPGMVEEELITTIC